MPGEVVGVIVTWIVASWPAAKKSGAQGASRAGSVAASQQSGSLESKLGSNASVVAVIEAVTGSVGAPEAPNGPTSAGEMNQSPCAMLGAASDAVGVSPALDWIRGSPVEKSMAKSTGWLPVVLAAAFNTRRVCRHEVPRRAAGNGTVVVADLSGASCSCVVAGSRASVKYSSDPGPPLWIVRSNE